MLPVSQPSLSAREREYVSEAIESGWISSTGKFVERFESEFATAIGVEHCIALSNGTVALHLALLGCGIGAGDEVIVPSLSFIASTNAVRYVGATPVFVDVSPDTWCIDPEEVRAAVTPRTKAIIAVHLYGQVADMDALAAIARERGLVLIEDAAEAHFAEYKGRYAGSLGDVATFSFFGNKVLTSGEGGALLTRDRALADRVRVLKNHGMSPTRRYWYDVVGYNFRMTNLAAAVLCAQLERRDELIARRDRIFALYDRLLGDVPGIRLQTVAPGTRRSPWLYCVLVDGEADARDRLMDHLRQRGIDSRPFFVPHHLLPPYEHDTLRPRPLTHTERLARQGLNLPTFPDMTEGDVQHVAESVREFIQSTRRTP